MLSLLKYFKDQSTFTQAETSRISSASFSAGPRSDDEWTWSSDIDEKNVASTDSTLRHGDYKEFPFYKSFRKRKPSHRIHPLLVVQQFSICSAGARTLLAQRPDLEVFSSHDITPSPKTAAALNGFRLPSAGLERVTNPLSFHQEQEVVENLAERFHAVFFVKVFLFIFLFDLEIEYLSLLSLVFFLHVNGVFEPLLRWIRNRRERWREAQPLHRVLRNLERRNQLQAIERVTLSSLRQQFSQPCADQQESERERRSPQQPVIPTSPPPAGAIDERTATTSDTHVIGEIVGAQEAQNADNLEPSRLQKCLYQTVVMYFGTSLPWWKPDQRYLV